MYTRDTLSLDSLLHFSKSGVQSARIMLSILQSISSWLSRYTSPFVIAAAVLAFVLPGMFTWVQGDVQAMVLGFIMLTMGMTLRPADFRILASCEGRLHPWQKHAIIRCLHVPTRRSERSAHRR